MSKKLCDSWGSATLHRTDVRSSLSSILPAWRHRLCNNPDPTTYFNISQNRRSEPIKPTQLSLYGYCILGFSVVQTILDPITESFTLNRKVSRHSQWHLTIGGKWRVNFCFCAWLSYIKAVLVTRQINTLILIERVWFIVGMRRKPFFILKELH